MTHSGTLAPVTEEFLREYGAPVFPGALPARPVRARAAPSAPFALRGSLILPESVLPDGYVTIADGSIAAIGAQKPQSVPVYDTGGVILPGLIDLHGHPDYNVFAPWEPPAIYVNRYAWQASDEYRAIITQPHATLKPLGTMLARYAEIRALVGGVTAIQGEKRQQAGAGEPLVRNVDLNVLGHQYGASEIFPLRMGAADVARVQQALQPESSTRAWYVHLAEGSASDADSKAELAWLVEHDLLTPKTVIIHGTALDREQLGQVKDAGAKLVWSPQSNLRLYGQTTDAAAALDLGIPMALGADWLPSGSLSLLAELRVARRVLANAGHPVTDRFLVDMVTQVAARIAGLDDLLGALAVGRPADLVVFEARPQADACASVTAADPSSVLLVFIGGDAVYGRRSLLDQVSPGVEWESVVAWGNQMGLDTSFAAESPAQAPLRLTDIRGSLIAHYPQVGPIFA